MTLASVALSGFPDGAKNFTGLPDLSYPVLSDYLVGVGLHNAEGVVDSCSRGGTMAAYTSSATAVLPAGAAGALALFR